MDIDTSNKDFINVIWISKDINEIVLKTSIVLPVVIFGIFGNILVIYVLIQNNHIRTPTNLLIGNMAAADLLSLLVHPWVALTYDFFQNYQLGTVGCRGEGAIECSVLIASVVSMSAVTYDRLTAIVLPNETRINKKGAKIIMAITWLAGIVLSIPLTLYRTYKERQWKNFLEKFCKEKTVIVNIYWYVIITVLVWLPLTIQLICYISIFIKLNKYERIMVRKLQHHQLSYKKSAARTMFIVIVTFMICRLPFTAFIIYRHQLLKQNELSSSNEVQNTVNGIYHNLWFISKYLIFVNACINPLIYCVTNEKFRRAFKKTKLAKWTTFDRKKKPIVVVVEKNKPILKTKSDETPTTTKKNVFFIFKKKPATVQANDTSTKLVEILNTKL